MEREVERLYQRVQLPAALAADVRCKLEAEITERQARNGDERDFQARRLVRLEEQRRKLMEAYYANAIALPLLREEQDRINKECREVEDRLHASDANLTEWQETLELAIRLVTDCGATYVRSKEKSRRMLNGVVFERLLVVDGAIREVVYRPPFDLVLHGRVTPPAEAAEALAVATGGGAEPAPVDKFEYHDLVGKARFELATSRSRTVHSNLAELLPEGGR